MNPTIVLPVLLAAVAPRAQQVSDQICLPPAAGLAQRALAADPWTIPIHADREDEGSFWASGPSYKVRFGTGMTFYPVLGAAAPSNLPLAWQTESAEIEGEVQLTGPAGVPERRQQPWRFELVRPGFTEAYDVRAAGVEQSFVIADPGRYAGTGDLVIRGRLTTPLVAADRAGTHAPLAFTDAGGNPVLEYGAAFALDAAGRKLPIASALRAGVVELRVPASWLQTAAWPVTVDPLTQRVSMLAAVNGPASYPVLAHDFVLDRHLVSESRAVSASDYDLKLSLRTAAWGYVATIFSELTTANTRYAALSYTSSPGRWLLAYERRTATTGRVRVYLHDANTTGLNTGFETEIWLPANLHDSMPSLGTQSGSLAYLALKRDVAPTPTDTEASYPVGYLIDTAARTVTTPLVLHTNPGSNYDVDNISVSRVTTLGWMVVWQEYNFDNPGDDWDIIVQQVGFAGQAGSYLVLGESNTNSLHKLTPYVDGFSLDWACAYVTRANTGVKNVSDQGSVLRVHRFHIGDGSLSVVGAPHTVDSAPGNDLVLGRTNHPFEMAAGTESHWGLGWRRAQTNELMVARIGFDGEVAEQLVVEAAPVAGYYLTSSLCWDADAFAFAMVYPSDGVAASDPVYGRHFGFDSRAQNTAYGTGCSGTVTAYASTLSSQPFAGTKSYSVELSNGRASVPTVLALSGAAADLPLGGGCRMLLDPLAGFATVLTTASSASGRCTLAIPIPSYVHGASVYWQFAQLDQGILTTSNALRTQVY